MKPSRHAKSAPKMRLAAMLGPLVAAAAPAAAVFLSALVGCALVLVTAVPAAAQSGQGSRVCVRLENALVAENRRDGQPQPDTSSLRTQRRALRNAVGRAEQRLEAGDCYEQFFFSRTLRRTRQCIRLKRTLDTARGRLARTERELQAASGTRRSGQDRRQALLSELARYNCGPQYQRQRRQRNTGWNPFSVFDRDGGGSGFFDNAPRQDLAPDTIQAGFTYRTMCVRLCDGYYFPVSYTALPSKFGSDTQICQQRCAAPTDLYVYRSPGGEVEQMITPTGAPYQKLETAFRYRKEVVTGCSCSASQYDEVQVEAYNAQSAKQRVAARSQTPLPPSGGLIKIKPREFDADGNEIVPDDGGAAEQAPASGPTVNGAGVDPLGQGPNLDAAGQDATLGTDGDIGTDTGVAEDAARRAGRANPLLPGGVAPTSVPVATEVRGQAPRADVNGGGRQDNAFRTPAQDARPSRQPRVVPLEPLPGG
ncbi:MAG: DUF2865 domain-containing protein [Pseudomonadota bacterium]